MHSTVTAMSMGPSEAVLGIAAYTLYYVLAAK